MTYEFVDRLRELTDEQLEVKGTDVFKALDFLEAQRVLASVYNDPIVFFERMINSPQRYIFEILIREIHGEPMMPIMGIGKKALRDYLPFVRDQKIANFIAIASLLLTDDEMKQWVKEQHFSPGWVSFINDTDGAI